METLQIREMNRHQSPDRFDKRAVSCRIIFLGTLAAILYHFILMRLPVFALGYPYDTFLYNPLDRFSDFNILFGPLVHGIHPYRNSVYFPGSYVILNSFLPFGGFALVTFLFISVTSTSILVTCLLKNKSVRERLYVLAAVLVSYPMLFGLDRANLDILQLPLILLWWILRSKGYHLAAAMCLGLAGSAKLYPLLLLLPDLIQFRVRRLLLTTGFVVFFTVLGLILMPSTFYESIQMLSRNLGLFSKTYAVNGAGWSNSISALSMVKTINLIICKIIGAEHVPLNKAISMNWNVAVLAGLVTMLWCGWRLRNEQEWKSIIAAMVAMMLLPSVSIDYKLIHLVLPFILFLNADPDENDRQISVIFALLLIPKSYVFLVSILSIAVVLNPLLLIILLAPVLRGQEVRRDFSQTADGRALRPPTSDLVAAYGLQNAQ